MHDDGAPLPAGLVHGRGHSKRSSLQHAAALLRIAPIGGNAEHSKTATDKRSIDLATSIVPGPAAARSGPALPHTPRRESTRSHVRRSMAAAAVSLSSSTAATSASIATKLDADSSSATPAPAAAPGQAVAASNGTGTGNASADAATERGESASASPTANPNPPTRGRRGSKWTKIRREVLPNPELVHVSERVQHIISTLRLPPEDRSESDVRQLYLWLMNQDQLCSLFTTMSEISVHKLCKEMTFLHLAPREIVVTQGETGNTCFIVLSGLVAVFVRSPEEQARYQRLVRSGADTTSIQQLVQDGTVTLGAQVATLRAGATFGELCLIEPDAKRSATVAVDASAHYADFIVLTAASYLRLTRSQTIQGTITDHMAFLQRMRVFRAWTKTQLLHLVNSLKLQFVAAGQYLARKGGDADALFFILRGEVHETLTLLLHEGHGNGHGHASTSSTNSSSMSADIHMHATSSNSAPGSSGATASSIEVGNDSAGFVHCVTVELAFLGKFDVAGEYLAAEKKCVACPVDLRAVTNVECLVLHVRALHMADVSVHIRDDVLMLTSNMCMLDHQRKLFQLHFGGRERDIKPHAKRALQRLRAIAQQREIWRETRMQQALRYPNIRVPITRRLMRLSGNACAICGRCSHVAGDELCMELATYNAADQVGEAHARPSPKAAPLPAPAPAPDVRVRADEDEEDAEMDMAGTTVASTLRAGQRLVQRQWHEAARAGAIAVAMPPPSTCRPASSSQVVTRVTSPDEIAREIREIRATWPTRCSTAQARASASALASTHPISSASAASASPRRPPRATCASAPPTRQAKQAMGSRIIMN